MKNNIFYEVMTYSSSLPAFRRNLLPKFSGQKNKPRRPFLPIFFFVSLLFFFSLYSPLYFCLLFYHLIHSVPVHLGATILPSHPTPIKVFPFQGFSYSPLHFYFIFGSLKLSFLQASPFFHPQIYKKFSSQLFFSLPFRDLPTPSSESSPF